MVDYARDQILRHYGISPTARLGQGMEAEAYTYQNDYALKIYASNANRADLLQLQHFYVALNRQNAPYALPFIHDVSSVAQHVVTIEQRLIGMSLFDVLPTLMDHQVETVLQRYIVAVQAVASLLPTPIYDRYKLFDPDQISQRRFGDWHTFLDRYLSHSLLQVRPYLIRDVPQFAAREQCLRAILAQPYQGDYSLIHGDFCPGNLLVDAGQHIIALLDFGMMTMFGDYLFDIATSWVFFDMYNRLQSRLRERCLALIIDQLGESVRGRLYCYVLLYSILSANAYSADCTDGHYQWCVANLATPVYWKAID